MIWLMPITIHHRARDWHSYNPSQMKRAYSLRFYTCNPRVKMMSQEE